jgi:ABC-2 type transport system ATP-binding protein
MGAGTGAGVSFGAVPAVEVEDLQVRYGPLMAVAGVSFVAEAGKITAVLGPNGAGKTSTIEVCEGYRRPTAGTVRVLGLEPAREQRALSARMGVMLQDGGVYPSARVGDMARLYCDLYGAGADWRELVDRVGLAERVTSAWRRLSGGEKQRLSLALALAAKPAVAFLDEPTSGVDVGGRATIRAILADLAASGCAVVLATHELDEVQRVADHVVVFDHGRVVASGTLDELRGSRRELRVRTRGVLDTVQLASAAGAPVRQVAVGEYVIDDPGPAALAAVSAWLETSGVEVIDLRSGAASLEDVFLRLTGEGG